MLFLLSHTRYNCIMFGGGRSIPFHSGDQIHFSDLKHCDSDPISLPSLHASAPDSARPLLGLHCTRSLPCYSPRSRIAEGVRALACAFAIVKEWPLKESLALGLQQDIVSWAWRFKGSTLLLLILEASFPYIRLKQAID